MYTVLQNTPMLFPDGRVMVLNQYNQWVEVRPLQPAFPAQPTVQSQLFQARSASRAPVSQACNISENIAEKVLEQPDEPALAELPAKARASCPVVEEEDEISISTPEMTFLSSQDRPHSSEHEAQSESGVSSTCTEAIDLSEDFMPLKQEVQAPPSFTTTVEVQKYEVERKVQVRSGPSAGSENLFVLTPGQTVHVLKTTKVRTKTGFVVTKAYVLCKEGQGWVSVNRQDKKTDDALVFKGQASAGFRRLVKNFDLWGRHNAKVEKIQNTGAGTFTLRVTCSKWQEMEALRSHLTKNKLRGRALLNKRKPSLTNLRRVFGNNRPCAHVFDLDVDSDNGHAEFLEDFDFTHQFQGSTKDFAHQVRDDLLDLGFKGVRAVNWSAGHTPSGKFSMRDFCSVEFGKDAQLREFLKNFEKYEFFQGAHVKVDPIYANVSTIPAETIKA